MTLELDLQPSLLSAIDAWITQQRDPTLSRSEAIRRLLLQSLGATSIPVPVQDDLAEYAGRIAFETYGPEGEWINPHESGSSVRQRWHRGFQAAADGDKEPPEPDTTRDSDSPGVAPELSDEERAPHG